jgi:heme-degrading monooxygenase HmoA
MTEWHLAQLNVARLRHPIDAPETADFVANLDPVNAIADAAPGFVWRLQDDSGNATSIHTDDDPLAIVNLSVWESIETLEAFVRRSPHAEVFRRRREWFERAAEAYLVLWWFPAGDRPTVADAMDRLHHLRVHGPTAKAFTLRERFDHP